MTKYLLIAVALFVNYSSLYAQQGWAMLKGQASSYYSVGTKGQQDEKNTPGMFNYGARWSYNGSLYLYGGLNVSSNTGAFINNADLWRYDTLTGSWEWISGPGLRRGTIINPQYTTLNQFNANNHPGSRYNAITWELNGKLYLFGGAYEYDDDPYVYTRSDLWVFDPVTKLWACINSGAYLNYGAQGVPAASNHPGFVKDAYSWVRNGKLYLYGGWHLLYGLGVGRGNNIWEYDPNNSVWTWIKGNSSSFNNGHWGTKNVTNSADMPAGGEKACWYSAGKLYVARDKGDELWEYDHATNNWTWIKGDTAAKPAMYGTKGISNALNTPGDKDTKASWEDNGKLYQISGLHEHVLWEFDPITKNWTWISGDTAGGKTVYGTFRQADTTVRPIDEGPASSWKFGNKAYHMFYKSSDVIWEYNHSTELWRWIKGSHNILSENYYVAEGLEHDLNEPSDVDPGAQPWQIGDTVYMYQCRGNKNIMWRYLTNKNQWNAIYVSYDTARKVVAKGVPSVNNSPGMKFGYGAATIGRKLFMFGGYENGSLSSYVPSEMWQFDLDNNVWTLLRDDGEVKQPIYGTMGVPAANNKPQGLPRPPMWTHNNKIYVLGGVLWQYDPPSNNWTWLKGDTLHRDTAVYGVKGVAAIGNQPAITRSAAHCVLNGKLYLAAGWVNSAPRLPSDWYYYKSSNVVWEYDPGTNNWTWLAGHKTNPVESYGTKGVAAATNTPGPLLAPRMVPLDGKLYLYGGVHYVLHDDIWTFDPLTAQWTWMDGNMQQTTEISEYKKVGQYDITNRTGGHNYHKMWVSGTRIYVFGGLGVPANTGLNNTSIRSNALWSYETCKNLSVCYANPPVVQLDSPVAICSGGVTLNAGNTGSRFLWSTSDTTQSITVRNPGKYWVTVTNPGGVQGSDTTIVITGTAPVFSLSDTLICASDSALVNVIQPSSARYRWSTGDTTAAIYTDSGMYYVQVTGNNGCYATDSMFVATKPAPQIPDLDYNKPLCAGSTLIINDKLSIQRTQSGLYGPNGFTGVVSGTYVLPQIKLSDAGAYYMVDTLGDCSVTDTLHVRIDSVYMPTVNVSVSPGTHTGPYVPLTYTANMNFGAHLSSFQWYKNGVLLQGENNIDYHAVSMVDVSDNDVICVGVGVSSFCVLSDTTSACAPAMIIDLSVDGVQGKSGVTVIPNPVKDNLYIRNIKPGATIVLYDQLGKIVYTKENALENEQISVVNMLSGTYFLNVSIGNETLATIKLLKM